jgi:hypothetical protein
MKQLGGKSPWLQLQQSQVSPAIIVCQLQMVAG